MDREKKRREEATGHTERERRGAVQEKGPWPGHRLKKGNTLIIRYFINPLHSPTTDKKALLRKSQLL